METFEQEENVPEPQVPAPHSRRRAEPWKLIALLLVVILFAITSPGEEKHGNAIISACTREHGLFVAAVGMLGANARYYSLVVCSVTVGDGAIISFGILGNVFARCPMPREKKEEAGV